MTLKAELLDFETRPCIVFDRPEQKAERIKAYATDIESIKKYLKESRMEKGFNTEDRGELEELLAVCYMSRGFFRYRAGDFAEAIADYTEAVSVDNQLYVAYYNRGMVHYRLVMYVFPRFLSPVLYIIFFPSNRLLFPSVLNWVTEDKRCVTMTVVNCEKYYWPMHGAWCSYNIRGSNK